MNIQPKISTAPQTPPAKAPVNTEPTPPQDPPAEDRVTFRDVAAIGAGAVAGTAGAVYGLGEGLIKGGIKAFPAHVGKGAEIGDKVLSPVGNAVGGAAAVVAVAGAVVATPALTVLSTVGGAVNGTIEGALVAGQTEVPKAITAGSEWASSAFGTALKTVGAAIGGVGAALVVLPSILYPPIGKELIPNAYRKGVEVGGQVGQIAGEAVGEVVGGIGGAVAGSAVSVYKGLPEGYEQAKTAGLETAKLVTELPSFAKEAWKTGFHGGGEIAGTVGSIAGGTVGFATATGATIGAGVNGSIDRATGWASATADFVRGEKATS